MISHCHNDSNPIVGEMPFPLARQRPIQDHDPRPEEDGPISAHKCLVTLRRVLPPSPSPASSPIMAEERGAGGMVRTKRQSNQPYVSTHR
jgi:hypothetical protein